jgi:hypothetical protein
MKYTIEDLKEGRCAVKNDGTLEELRKVLELACPDGFSALKGIAIYYYADKSTRKWCYGAVTSLPFQSVKDFLTDEFVLPEKWCVKNPNNKVESLLLYKYATKVTGRTYSGGTFYHFPDHEPLKCTSRYIIEGYTEITFEEFKKYILKKEENMDNRFPFKISAYHAQLIINIACNDWKDKLATMWGPKIVIRTSVVISEEFYKEMRKACTNEQHDLFDEIFGKDQPDFKAGDYITVVKNTARHFNGIPGVTYKITGINENNHLQYEINNSINPEQVEVRYATPEEIAEYNSYKYTDVKPVWVKNRCDDPWDLRYTTGKIVKERIQCYNYQKKTGDVFSYWAIYKPATGVVLPED